jgi:transcriptional regulator with XRE-family HTH domain
MKLEVLREIRKVRGITLKEMSDKVGINSDRLSLIERGKVNPSFETVDKMVDALGCCLIVHLDVSLIREK